MFKLNENDRQYRFGDSGPKYLMKGPRSNFALVQFHPGEDFRAHYHNVMEENFFILSGEVDIVVDGVVHHLTPGDLIHIEPKWFPPSPPSRRWTRWRWKTRSSIDPGLRLFHSSAQGGAASMRPRPVSMHARLSPRHAQSTCFSD